MTQKSLDVMMANPDEAREGLQSGLASSLDLCAESSACTAEELALIDITGTDPDIGLRALSERLPADRRLQSVTLTVDFTVTAPEGQDDLQSAVSTKMAAIQADPTALSTTLTASVNSALAATGQQIEITGASIQTADATTAAPIPSPTPAPVPTPAKTTDVVEEEEEEATGGGAGGAIGGVVAALVLIGGGGGYYKYKQKMAATNNQAGGFGQSAMVPGSTTESQRAGTPGTGAVAIDIGAEEEIREVD
jgi:hypothetical protein